MPPSYPSTRYVVKYDVAAASSGDVTVTRTLDITRRESRSAGRPPK